MLILPLPLQGWLMAFSPEHPRPLFYSPSLLAALDTPDSFFLEIFLTESIAVSRFSFLRCPGPGGFLLAPFPDHLPPHCPTYHLNKQLTPKSISSALCLAGCWQKWMPYWDWIIGAKFNLGTSQGWAKGPGKPKGSAVPRSVTWGLVIWGAIRFGEWRRGSVNGTRSHAT